MLRNEPPMILDALRSPAYASSRRAVLPFALLVAGAAWLGGWGWWSLAAPLLVFAGLAAVGAIVWLLAKVLDRSVPVARTWTRLDQTDPSAQPSPPPDRATLDALLGKGPAPSAGWAESRLYLKAYRRDVPLRVICDQEEGLDGVWPETVAAIAAVHGWTKSERAEVRRLLLSDAQRALAEVDEPCPFTLATIEAEAKVVALTFVQTDAAHAGLGLLELSPSWEPEHGVAIVLRDGRPDGIINGLVQDPHDVFAD